MIKVAIVTDSTADLHPSFYEKNDVTMVPLVVRFGDEEYRDWVELPPERFYPMLRSSNVLPKTSQPSVQQFVEAYQKHVDCDHIISIHLSSHLSGTYQAASIAAENVSTPVTVIDSKLASLGLGVVVDELVTARESGANAGELIELANRLVHQVKIAFCVDTMKYLEMGGRIGKASALAGSILNIKPILTLQDGVVTPLRKVKGSKRLIREIVEVIKAASVGTTLNLGLVHADAQAAVEELEASLKAEGVDYNMVLKSEIGCVIGTYTGPGCFAVLYYPAL